MNAVCAVPSRRSFVPGPSSLTYQPWQLSASSRFEKTTMPFPQEEENKKKRIKGMEEEEGDEGVGASGSLRSLVIFITRKRLTLLFVSLPYESLPRSIFKLTGHSNEFSLFSRHYKYNLEREYFAVPHPINRSTSHPSSFFILSAMKENFGGKIRRFLSLSIISRSISLRYQTDVV